MNIAFCYDSVLPARGGCETYIAQLARRLVADGHAVHLYACRWDADALPTQLHTHAVQLPRCPRFLRPWFFSGACARALHGTDHQVTIGFDKIVGMDVVYPQGGLHIATARHNLLKYRNSLSRAAARLLKWFDPAYFSFALLEKRQYLNARPPLVIAISEMVREHFQTYYGLPAETLRLVRLAPDGGRFDECDRPKRRHEWRQQWGIAPDKIVALFAALNYRLKGLEPLLHAVRRLGNRPQFRLLVAGNPDTSEFARLATRLGIADRVHFVGYCPDMRNAYFAADFFVHPTFYDPCSHVVLEAMSCGLPVITTRYNGASEFLQPPREGFVIDDPHDHEKLAWSLGQLLDPARRIAAGQAARRTASQWTFEQHYREILAVFAEAAARKRAA